MRPSISVRTIRSMKTRREYLHGVLNDKAASLTVDPALCMSTKDP